MRTVNIILNTKIMTERERREKREKAINIINNYSMYHAGTAITVGAFGGQFGVDSYALTALTIMMIEQICNVYGIKNRTAKNIHIARAISRLKASGTVVAHAILNWLPLGSLVNGTTTYFLTRNAGMKCIDEIESEQMTIVGQLLNAGKDYLVRNTCNAIGEAMDGLQGMSPEGMLENTKEILGANLTEDLNIDNIIEAIDKIPTELARNVNVAVSGALKASVKECLFKDPKEVNSSQLLKNMFFDAICGIAVEHTKLTRKEIEFRFVFQNSDYDGTFDEFLQDIADRYDELAKERGMLEAVKLAYSSISNEIKLRMGVTSEEITNSILNNPYDKEIEQVYRVYLPMISDSDNQISALAKASLLYQNLHVINYRYNVPNTSLAKKDNDLIYFVAGRIKKEVGLFAELTEKEIAFILSEFIEKHDDVINIKVSLPIIGFCNDLRKNEETKINKVVCVYWKTIAENCKKMQSVWSDGVALYIHRYSVRNILYGMDTALAKDDKLIYTSAEILKNELEILKDIDINVVAYYMAETLDKYLN